MCLISSKGNWSSTGIKFQRIWLCLLIVTSHRLNYMNNQHIPFSHIIISSEINSFGFFKSLLGQHCEMELPSVILSKTRYINGKSWLCCCHNQGALNPEEIIAWNANSFRFSKWQILELNSDLKGSNCFLLSLSNFFFVVCSPKQSIKTHPWLGTAKRNLWTLKAVSIQKPKCRPCHSSPKMTGMWLSIYIEKLN